jgi:DUF4097 and DUF4098 domain-containing protein YvlB
MMLLAMPVVVLAACGRMASSSGTFDRTLSVQGPVQIHITNAAGMAKIVPSPDGQVHIHAEFTVGAWPWQDSADKARRIASDPPIKQQGGLIHIGEETNNFPNFSITYTIEAPADTELHGAAGSGSFDVTGIRGPVQVTTGSGDSRITGVQQDVELVSGSGHISVAGAQGDVDVSAGSGNIETAGCHGTLHAHTDSGDISVAGVDGAVTIGTGSGDVKLAGLQHDARVETASGAITVAGSPASQSYWEFHTSSGKVTLQLPPDAKFRLYAHSESGRISSDISLAAEESDSKHDLRAHTGEGDARIEIRTISGGIHLE